MLQLVFGIFRLRELDEISLKDIFNYYGTYSLFKNKLVTPPLWGFSTSATWVNFFK